MMLNILSRRFFSKSVSNCALCTTVLPTRALLRLRGADTLPFLQGLVTNDVNLLESEKSSLFTFFLNHQGRIVFDTILYKDGNNNILLECDSDSVNLLTSHLKKFKLRRKVNIESVTDLNVAVLFDNSTENKSSEVEGIKKDCAFADADPRLTTLGHRLILPTNKELKIENKCNPNDYKSFRYKLGVLEGASEYSNGFPMECNGDLLNALSFSKGCYIGQETTARVYHTGVIRKRILPFKFENSQINAEDLNDISDIVNTDGKSIAKVKGICSRKNEALGLALVRLQYLKSNEKFKLKNEFIKFIVPPWFPSLEDKNSKVV